MIELFKRPKGGLFIRMDRATALAFANSIIEQVANNSPNVGRLELRDKQGKYFSIAVEPMLDINDCDLGVIRSALEEYPKNHPLYDVWMVPCKELLNKINSFFGDDNGKKDT